MVTASASQATTLFTVTNAPAGDDSLSFTFTAVATTTTITFGGYNLPAFDSFSNNGVFLDGAGPNLLGASWNFAPAPAGSDSYTYDDGTSVPALGFGSVDVGSYDEYSQTFATTVGASYTLDTLFSASGFSPSGEFITTGAVPEPATWAMMLVGFGLAGAALRGRKVRVAT